MGLVQKLSRVKARLALHWQLFSLVRRYRAEGFVVAPNGTVTCARCLPEDECLTGSHCAHTSTGYGYSFRLRALRNQLRQL